MERFSHESLLNFSKNVFLKMGFSAVDAQTAADSLVSADLRGVDSHGVARLTGYVRLWEAGRANATPAIRVVHETPSTAVVDGDAGLGLVVAPYAMKIAIEKAKSAGTGWVAVKNSNHFGIAGYHAMLALEHDMIGFAMTNASALVAPTFSKDKMLGTNPIAFAVPAGEEQPFVADFATTTAANGKLENLQRKNMPVPKGWVQDKDGFETANAHVLMEGGSLLPLGGTREGSSHKGFMLGSMVDILSGVLSGANYGPWVPPFPAYVPMPQGMPGLGIGHFFGAMRIDAFAPATEFKANMDKWIRSFRDAKPIHEHQRVVIPGEPETELTAMHYREGIKLLKSVVSELHKLGEKLGVSPGLSGI